MRLSITSHTRLHWTLSVPLLQLPLYFQGPGSKHRDISRTWQGSGLMRGLTSEPGASLAFQIWYVSLAKCQKEGVRREWFPLPLPPPHISSPIPARWGLHGGSSRSCL